jgi:peptide-methionine (R)-S-oxide reductase
MTYVTRRQLGVGLGAVATIGIAGQPQAARAGDYPVTLSDAEWRKRLTRAQYVVLRQDGTETPYTSPLNKEKRAGTFTCAGCDQPLFSSAVKYESNTGWPSFWQALPGATGQSEDRSLRTVRTGVHCARCGGHLGHVFDDGPPPTGKRYCMNGVAMRFRPGPA